MLEVSLKQVHYINVKSAKKLNGSRKELRVFLVNRNIKMEIGKIQYLAKTCHEGQKRWDGEPYINHVERVAQQLPQGILQEIAWLHDVLEDTKTTEDDLKKNDVSDIVIRTVKILTRGQEVNYKDYILRISKSELATRVKIADLKDNLRNLKEMHSY